jgi:hypothetical protein
MCDGNRKRFREESSICTDAVLAMPELLAAGANFSGTQDLPRLDELSE